MNQPGDAGSLSGFEEVFRSFDGHLHEVGPGSPVADAGRGVIDALDAVAGLEDGRHVGKVAFDKLDALAAKPGGVGGGPDQGAHGPSAFAKLLDDMAAQ